MTARKISTFWILYASGRIQLNPEFALRDIDTGDPWTKKVQRDGHTVDYVKSGKVYITEFAKYTAGDYFDGVDIEGKIL